MFRITNIGRMRINRDGEGIRTLILTADCPLRCKYCINPHTWNGKARIQEFDAEGLYEKISLDRLYFISTNGGVTFGGGEPLLYAEDILHFKRLCKSEFSVYAETSLNVPEENILIASKCVDRFIVDIKTMESDKYSAYTGGNLSRALSNLTLLIQRTGAECIKVRIPVIPGFSSYEDQKNYQEKLIEYGIRDFDCFTYSRR